MLPRLFFMFALALGLSACSSTDESTTLDTQVTSQREGITTDGALNDIYQSEVIDADGPISGTQEDLVVNVGDRAFFGNNRFDVDNEARLVLERQANWLRQHPGLNIIIEGHADERGTREYNLALGERRANSMKNYLIALGVAQNRIETVTYGKERPAVAGASEAAWAQNRRGVVKVN